MLASLEHTYEEQKEPGHTCDTIMEWASLGGKGCYGLFREFPGDTSRLLLAELRIPDPDQPLNCHIVISRYCRYNVSIAGCLQGLVLVTTINNWDKAVFEYHSGSNSGVLRFTDWREYHWSVSSGMSSHRFVTDLAGNMIFRATPAGPMPQVETPEPPVEPPGKPRLCSSIDIVTVPGTSESCHDLLLMASLDFVLHLAHVRHPWRSGAAFARCA